MKASLFKLSGVIISLSLLLTLLPGQAVHGRARPERSYVRRRPDEGPGRPLAAHQEEKAAGSASPTARRSSNADSHRDAQEAYLDLPLHFVENTGQYREAVRFYARRGGMALYFTPEEMVMALPETVLRTRFLGASSHVRVTGHQHGSATFNYFVGDDPGDWQSDIRSFKEVRYRNLYPGIDLSCSGRDGTLKYEFVLAPGVGADAIRLSYRGAEGLRLAENGDLLISLDATGGATVLRDTAPVAHQEIAGERRTVDARFTLHDDQTVGLRLGDYDSRYPLVIDPQLRYSTFLGGSSEDGGYAIALDGSNNVYVAGETSSAAFPTSSGAYGANYDGGNSDVFVSVLDPTLGILRYSTFLGGDGGDDARAVALGSDGSVRVAGNTDSADFPTTDDAWDATHNGDTDVFLSVLDPTLGTLQHATFLGGSDADRIGDISLDASDAVYVTGDTKSEDFPTTPGVYDGVFNGGGPWGGDAFVSVLDPALSTVRHSTFLGGSASDEGIDLVVDGSRNTYVLGETRSAGFPTTDAAYDSTQGGYADVFVGLLDPTLRTLVYSTFLGGRLNDFGRAIALTDERVAYLTGETYSDDFPTTIDAYNTHRNGGYADAFVSALDPEAGALRHSTFLGGTGWESAAAIALDADANVYLTGATDSNDFPVTDQAYDRTYNGDTDGFLSVLPHDLESMRYTSFLGGSAGYEGDRCQALALDGTGNVYLTGRAHAGDFPTTGGAYDTSHNGGGDVFVSVLDSGVQPTYSISGQITDANAEPVSNVTVSAGPGVSATTDASGIYTIADLPAGTYTVSPVMPGYFWSPASRTVAVPPAVTSQDFTGRNARKRGSVRPSQALPYSASITYTVELAYPTQYVVSISDPVPTYTSYVSGSLAAPAGIAYCPATDAISGTLTLGAGVPQSVTFGVRVEVTGTAHLAPVVRNRACLHPPDGELADCRWTNEIVNFTYVRSLYLPMTLRRF